MRESAAGRIGTGMLLGMVGFAILWLVQLPFGLAELWWERRHDISKESYLGWLVDSWFGLGGAFLFICLAILIVMAAAGVVGQRWWLPATPALVGAAVLVAFLQPFLLPDLHGLRSHRLAADARRLERLQGLPHIPVKVQKVHKLTTAPNAEAAGLGPSRRVVLWDTLLDGRFTTDQVQAVLAHELAHHSRDHVAKGLGWYALFAFPIAFGVALMTGRRGGLYRPEAVPLALLVAFSLQLATLPLQNVISRRLEREADWVALQSTRDPASARKLFERFSTTSRSEPRPATFWYVALHDHPTIMQRIAMAKAWEARARRRGAQRVGAVRDGGG
jgi:STE24 endopeptidase